VSTHLAPLDNAVGCYQWELSSKQRRLRLASRSNCTNPSACKSPWIATNAIRQHLEFEFELRSGHRSGPSFAISVTSTAKQEAKPSVGKAAARGVQGVSTAWAVNASSVTYFSMPTLHNLACMPLGVNHLDGLEHANRLHRWLPGLGTFGAQGASFKCQSGLRRNDDCAYPQQSEFVRKAFIRFGIDMGKAIVRDSSNRRFRCQGVLACRAPYLFTLLRTSRNSGPCSCKNSGRGCLDDCHEEDRGFAPRVNLSIDGWWWK
jgi:hypothetical protein